MSTRTSVDKEVQLWILMRRTNDAMSKIRNRELRGTGVSVMQVAVIFLCSVIEGVATPGEISRWLFREPNTISELLNRMEKKGLVEKSKINTKKNSVGIKVTEKGRQRYEKAMEKEFIKSFMSTLTSKEQDQLLFLLNKLMDKVILTLKPKRKLPWF